ncbi:hypothetical protein BV898_14874 [Hypsibius exemplaris]|uniref:Uncharacterized protein n=1 Tax=Hypsibius exemplaris TaxID=2072580 RepID=A0A9X6N9F9_HYPEX|nr:hypothetical protein BV898_14874 [Hypsibius exemplaris]
MPRCRHGTNDNRGHILASPGPPVDSTATTQTSLTLVGSPLQQISVSDSDFSLNNPTAARHGNVVAAEFIDPLNLIAPDGNDAMGSHSETSTILFPGSLISEGKEARFRRKVQRLLPPGLTMSDDAFAVLYQATRAAFSNLVGQVDGATFQMIVGPPTSAPTTTPTGAQGPLNFTVGALIGGLRVAHEKTRHRRKRCRVQSRAVGVFPVEGSCWATPNKSSYPIIIAL